MSESNHMKIASSATEIDSSVKISKKVNLEPFLTSFQFFYSFYYGLKFYFHWPIILFESTYWTVHPFQK